MDDVAGGRAAAPRSLLPGEWGAGQWGAGDVGWGEPHRARAAFAEAPQAQPPAAWALAGPAEIRAALRRRRRRMWWARLRRPLAALVVVLAVAVVVRGWRGAPTSAAVPTVDVWVAVRDLPAGARVTATDQRRVPWPASLVPPSALTAPAEGVLGGAMASGEPFTRTRLLGPGALTGQRPDVVALAFPVPAALATVVRPGDRLQLVPVGAAASLGPEHSTESEGITAPQDTEVPQGTTAPPDATTPGAAPPSEVAVVLRGPARAEAGDPAGVLGPAPAAADDGAVTVVLGVPAEAVARLAGWDPQRVVVTLLPAGRDR